LVVYADYYTIFVYICIHLCYNRCVEQRNGPAGVAAPRDPAHSPAKEERCGRGKDTACRRWLLRGDKRTEAELVEAIAEEESRLGRSMTPSEREEFARRFFAPEYRQEQRGLEIRDLMAALGFGEAEEDEG
jgi:hypothetical protein